MSQPRPSVFRRWRGVPRWARICSYLVLIFGVLAATLFVAPRYAARWWVASTLNDLGIEHAGTETIDIDLWDQTVSVGPIALRRPGTDPAKLKHFTLELSLSALARRHFLSHQVVIEGVDIRLVRTKDGRLVINDLPFPAPPPAPADAKEKADGDRWGVGLEHLVLRDSRLLVEDRSAASGGRATISIDELSLDGFWSWRPDQRGRYALKGSINDIKLDSAGEAAPFADRLELSGKTRIEAATIERIEAVVGPLGLDRRNGTFAADFQHDVTVSRQGAGKISVDGTLRLSGGDIAAAGGGAVTLDSATLALKGQAEIAADGERQGSFEGTLQLSRGDLAAGAASLKAAKADVRFKGKARVTAKGGVAASGAVRATMDDAVSAASDGRVKAERVVASLDGFTLALAGSGGGADQRLSLKSPLHLRMDRVDATTAGESLAAGRIELKLAPSDAAFRGAAGKITTTADEPHTLAIRDLTAKSGPDSMLEAGRLALSLERPTIDIAADGATQISASATVTAAGAHLKAPMVEPDLAGAIGAGPVKAVLNDIDVRLNANDATPRWRLKGSLTIDKPTVALGQKGDMDATAASIAAKGFSVGAPGPLALGTVEFDGLQMTAKRSALARLSNGGAEEPKAEGGVDLKALSLESLTANKTKLQLVDDVVSPTVSSDLVIEKLTLKDVDGAAPESAGSISLNATINQFTAVKIEGKLAPFAQHPRFDLNGELKNLQLARLSPYAGPALGVAVKNGDLSVEAQGKVARNGALDSRLNLDIRKLEVAPLSAADAAKLSEKVGGMPVSTAIGLLEDSSGRINLKIPVTGDIDNPQFDFGQVVSRAVGGAIRQTLSTTVKVLFPPALLLSVFDNAKGGISFKPVTFDAMAAELDSAGNTLATLTANMLVKHPRVRIAVCGRATAGDFDAWLAQRASDERKARLAKWQEETETWQQTPSSRRTVTPPPPPPGLDVIEQELAGQDAVLDAAKQELGTLATKRTNALRGAITAGDKIGLDRVGECPSVYDRTDKGPPRAVITF